MYHPDSEVLQEYVSRAGLREGADFPLQMSIYISSPSCPAFIPLLHGLIAADLLPDPPHSPDQAQITRLSCAMAVVRFVNGMVDPLQSGESPSLDSRDVVSQFIGPYARPISHIAASLGIPPSLISLRHRATHEDLPPLPLLRTAIHQAINYIHHYSFLPMLSSSSALSSTPRSGRAEELIKRWKGIMKFRLSERVVGEENDSGRELRGLRKALAEEDALDIVEALCGADGVVPVGRKWVIHFSSCT
jgi:ribosomal biogenesis protein LAS1